MDGIVEQLFHLFSIIHVLYCRLLLLYLEASSTNALQSSLIDLLGIFKAVNNPYLFYSSYNSMYKLYMGYYILKKCI